MRRRSLTFRVLLGAVIWVTLALGAGGFAVLEVFRASALRQFDQRILDELTLLSVGIARNPDDPGAQMTSPSFSRVFSGLYWQAEMDREASFKSRSLWDLSLPLSDAGMARVTSTIAGPDNQTLRLMTKGLQSPNGQVWRIGVANDMSVLKRETAQFQRGLIPAAAFLLAALIAAAILLLRTALRPLGRLRQAVRDLSTGQDSVQDAVFLGDEFPSEVAPLVNDLNVMLDKNTRLRERGRAQAANLAHALKTPAAVLQNEIDRADAGHQIDVSLANEAVARIADAAAGHMSHAASGPDALAPGQQTNATAVLSEISRAIERLFPNLQVIVDAPSDLPVRITQTDLQEIFGNLLENAGKWAIERVEVQLRCIEGSFKITVLDDGPGILPADRDRVLRKGVRLDTAKSGTGLGLSIVEDIVYRYDGTLVLDDSDKGGLKVTIDIPNAD